MKFKVGDMVTPGPAFVGHRNVFTVSEENLIDRTFRIRLFADITNAEDNIPHNNISWKEDELELIRTIESLKDASKHCFIEDVMQQTAMYYKESEWGLPEIFSERDFGPKIGPVGGLTRVKRDPKDCFEELKICSSPLNSDVLKELAQYLYPVEKTSNPFFKHWNYNLEEENKMYKILDIYETKQRTKINNIYNERIESLIEDDEIQKIIKEMENQVRTIAGERAEGYCFAYPGLYEERTAKAIKELEQERDQKVKELRNKIIDIKALGELAPNYEEKLKILRDYEIIDKKKNIIL